MARKLGQLEVAALAYVQMRKIRVVRTGDLAAALRITAKLERELLSRMARSRMIAKVRNGLYLFPAKLPLGGVWTPDDATAINALIADKQARYQITGPCVFNRYGYDEQIPSRLTLYNDAISGERSIGRVNLTLITVGPDRLGGTEQVQMPSGETLVYSSRIRTLVDAVYDWSRFDSLPRAYDWIRRDVAARLITIEDLTNMALRYGNTGSIRRIGVLLEELEADERVLRKLPRALRPSSAKIPFVPNRPARGPLGPRRKRLEFAPCVCTGHARFLPRCASPKRVARSLLVGGFNAKGRGSVHWPRSVSPTNAAVETPLPQQSST